MVRPLVDELEDSRAAHELASPLPAALTAARRAEKDPAGGPGQDDGLALRGPAGADCSRRTAYDRRMDCMVLSRPAPAAAAPLALETRPDPAPGEGESARESHLRRCLVWMGVPIQASLEGFGRSNL